MTALRDLEGVKGNGKLDAFRVDWRIIRHDPDNDLRDLTTADNRAHIEQIKDSIEADGVKDVLIIRTDEHDAILAIDGRVRLVALAELDAEGRKTPETVLVLPEPRGTSREDRTINMILLSSLRKNYDPFEVARGLKRLADFGMSPEKICERMRFKSIATLNNYLDSLAMKPVLHDMVAKGKISRTEALKLQKRTDADPGEIMQAAEEEHKRLHKKGEVKVKPRHVKRVTQKPKIKSPIATPEQIAEVLGDPVPNPPATFMVPTRPLNAMEPGEVRAGSLSDEEPPVGQRYEPMFDDGKEKWRDTKGETQAVAVEFTAAVIGETLKGPSSSPLPPPASGAVQDLILALKPFAELANDHDLTAKDDADLLEVFVRDVKRAWEVYARVVGDTQEEAA